MATRDRVAEIADIKRRAPRDAEGVSRQFDALQRHWVKARAGDSVTDDFFLIRAVTLLEVFTKGWVAALIDHGSPFVERAGDLKVDFKFDFGSVRKIGNLITLGDAVAHGISLNNVGQIMGVFKVLLGEDVLPLMQQAVYVHRYLMDQCLYEGSEERQAGTRIVKDPDRMCSRLSRLFEIRHILCHEAPRNEVYERRDITGFLAAADQFACALNEVLYGRLFPNAPTTYPEMAAQAKVELEENEQLLADVVSRLDGTRSRKAYRLLNKANKSWMEFRDAYAEYRATGAGPVTKEWLRLLTANRLTESHINELMQDIPVYDDE